MIIGRVKGTVSSTVKNQGLDGHKILVVQPLDLEGQAQGDAFLAVDAVSAGEGDLVIVMKEGSSARLVLDSDSVPVAQVIMGIIDEIHIEGQS